MIRQIHKIWLGDKPISKRYLDWNRLLVDMNPDWAVTIWRDNDLVENAGIKLKPLYDKFWSHASVSNMVRLALVYRFGGMYLDMDMEPIKPIGPLSNQGFATAADQGDGRICNAYFMASAYHPWVKWQIERGSGETDPHDAAWGVYTMTEAPREGFVLTPTERVYPFHYQFPKAQRKPHENSVFAHHWDGSWTKK